MFNQEQLGFAGALDLYMRGERNRRSAQTNRNPLSLDPLSDELKKK
jgi:hypothetical protein